MSLHLILEARTQKYTVELDGVSCYAVKVDRKRRILRNFINGRGVTVVAAFDSVSDSPRDTYSMSEDLVGKYASLTEPTIQLCFRTADR